MPKHIHWVVDVLMKMQSNNSLTNGFLKKIRNYWDKSIGLSDNDFVTLKDLIEEGMKEF